MLMYYESTWIWINSLFLDAKTIVDMLTFVCKIVL